MSIDDEVWRELREAILSDDESASFIGLAVNLERAERLIEALQLSDQSLLFDVLTDRLRPDRSFVEMYRDQMYTMMSAALIGKVAITHLARNLEKPLGLVRAAIGAQILASVEEARSA